LGSRLIASGFQLRKALVQRISRLLTAWGMR
jgi:hypothetical protein